MKKTITVIAILLAAIPAYQSQKKMDLGRWLSIGGRSTLNLFDHDGVGLGTGGQVRIRFSERVNTDWFADYILISNAKNIRSEYYHVGWSVMYYCHVLV